MTEINRAPDGLGGFRGSSHMGDVQASTWHDSHDDGLVHGHAWASSSEMTAPHRAIRQTSSVGYEITWNSLAYDDGHDDGLVHGHTWAVNSR